MSSFNDIIKSSGKGLESSKDIIYLLDVCLGGTLGDNATGTYTAASLGRDVEGIYYKSKLQDTGSIHRSVQPENGQFETADLSISLANGDLEFSRWPWNTSILNKPSILKLGFSGSNVIEYLADCSYNANCSIKASGGPFGAGGPGDISVGIAYTLYKGIIKKEERSNKEFKVSIGDYTNKIFRDIPPRVIKISEFPNAGTSVGVLGTKTDFETDIIGKNIPYIYGDFTDAPLIHPIFIDTIKHRYLIADHAIGTVVKVWSGGTQVFNLTSSPAGTHTSNHIMSFIDFGTSQGTKQVYVEIKGKLDSLRDTIGTISYLGSTASIEKDFFVGNYYAGAASSFVQLSQKFTGTVGSGTYISFGCYIKQNEHNAGFVKTVYGGGGQTMWGTATTIGTYEWVSVSVPMLTSMRPTFELIAYQQTTGVSFDEAKFVIGSSITPTIPSDGTGLLLNGNFTAWAYGTIASNNFGGTHGPDNWYLGWSHAAVANVTVSGTGVGSSVISTYGTFIISHIYNNVNFGTVLTNPALILKDFLTDSNLCALSSSDIGTSSFDTAKTWLNTFSFRHIMNGEIYKNSIDFIQDLSVNAMSNFYFDKENQANFSVYRPAISRTYIRKIQQNEILEDSFSITRDIRDVYNRVVVNYDYDWIKGEYRNVYETSGTNFVTQFDTVRTFNIDSPFIYSSTEASYSARKWLAKLQGGLNKISFSVPISMLPMDVGERIQISHDEPPTVSGGWADRLINITEFSIDNKNKMIEISAIDEDEISLGKHYFILGDGGTTHFYGGASEVQRYYGCLSSLGGTMGNSDLGYRLWVWWLLFFIPFLYKGLELWN